MRELVNESKEAESILDGIFDAFSASFPVERDIERVSITSDNMVVIVSV